MYVYVSVCALSLSYINENAIEPLKNARTPFEF